MPRGERKERKEEEERKEERKKERGSLDFAFIIFISKGDGVNPGLASSSRRPNSHG